MSTKRKLPHKLGHPVLSQGVKTTRKSVVDESRTVVCSGDVSIDSEPREHHDVIKISSGGEDEPSDSEAEAEAMDLDTTMENTNNLEETLQEDAEKSAEPSFGEMIRANAPETVDVVDSFDGPESRVISHPKATLQAPSGASLGTVLSQALRTNDIALLESCLHTSDLTTIRATIQRLESSLAAKLLQKLAERIHRRPGRAGNLMVWVQWTLVAHGGYLTTQRSLMQCLTDLTKVINGRSRGLQSVLSLKGKLDMLEAQLELRRSIQNNRPKFEDEDDDERIIYVEGEEDDRLEGTGIDVHKLNVRENFEDDSDEESGQSDDMPTVNGMIADSEDEDDSSEGDDDDGDDGGLIDDEAEETDADSS